MSKDLRMNWKRSYCQTCQKQNLHPIFVAAAAVVAAAAAAVVAVDYWQLDGRVLAMGAVSIRVWTR